MPLPKLRPGRRTEVPELAAPAAVGTLDAATSSQRFHVPNETVKARKGGWVGVLSVDKELRPARDDGPPSSLKYTTHLASHCPNLNRADRQE